jgi:hypothetical protein
MNRLILFFSISILLFAFDLSIAQDTKTEAQKLTLRVTSITDKPVSFVASIFFKTTKMRLDNVLQETPYEITVESDYVNAIFIKTSGDGSLFVTLIKHKKVGKQPDLKASGSTIIVGTHNADEGVYYQQTF